MAHVVFDADLDSETLKTIQELRLMQRDAVKRQLDNLSETIESLVSLGAIQAAQKASYSTPVRIGLEERLQLIDGRIKSPDTVYSDELELYLDILSSADSE